MQDSDRQRPFGVAREVIGRALPQAWAAYVYGSVARGDDWPDSDLDVAVLAWEAEQMSDYADFNPRRAGILDVFLHAPLSALSPPSPVR